MALQQISNSTELKAGDKIQIHIKSRLSLGSTIDAYLLAGQISKISGDARYEITSWDYLYDEQDKLKGIALNIVITDKVNVIEAGVITPAVIISALVVVGMITFSITTFKVMNVIDNPQNPNAAKLAGGIEWAAVAAVLFALYFLFRKRLSL